MNTTAKYLSLYFKRVQNWLQLMISRSVDGTISAVKQRFQEETLDIFREFDSNPRQLNQFIFVGAWLLQTPTVLELFTNDPTLTN